ncbi:MAG: hypothetical protein DMF63_01525 [Acidobacteria bacterium]|nr:MAG: hypothetical protein DMF63_01525 [Acidobacteriota bacterium]
MCQSLVELTPEKDSEKLQKEAVAFLRETLTDVNGMRSLENRISFTAELAGLMWFHDEREARSMYGGVIADFKDLLTKYDAQMNELGATMADRQGGGFMSFGLEPTDKSQIVKRFTTAVGVRQQIAMTMAEHDPELAFSFYNDSLSAISNPEFRKEIERQDPYFETQLLTQIAQRDPAKAAQLATVSLKKGVTYQHIDLLKKIYAKNTEKGIEFGAAILSRLKTDKYDSTGYRARENFLSVIEYLIRFGDQRLNESRERGGKRPVYMNAEVRELVELMAQVILSQAENDMAEISNIDLIQKYSPGRASQIRAKFKNSTSRYSSMSNSANAIANTAAYYGGASNANANMSPEKREKLEKEVREAQERQELETRTMEGVQNLPNRELPKEEREKIVAQARGIIMQTPGRDKKIMGLSMLATQVSKAGDKELAKEIMRDAESMVNPSPKNYQDFILTWMLASGYASADPDKAFPLLEETIGRANDTLAAFIKVGEFIDVAEEVIQDGEVQVGAFGGQMVRGLTKELGMADTTIEVLANADFAKTKALTNRFDRAEIRILAKMMVLRAVLDPKKAGKPDAAPDVDVDY